MTQPTYTFSEMTFHILNGDADTLPIIADLLSEERDGYPAIELAAMYDLLKLQYDVIGGRLMKELLASILK